MRVALEDYRKKRDFEKTPEPAGEPRPEGGFSYVIQKHAATRLHYDFRLELDGVLLSWAVPKGPSLDPRDKRMAVHVEDHPVAYGSFEGTIPKGEYGGGTVLLWDRGTWEPEADPREGMAKGELKFSLQGEKLRGSWVLVRTKPRPGQERQEQWLLIKHRDEFAVDGEGQAILTEEALSVASGRSLEEIAAEEGSSVWHSSRPADAQTEVRPAEEFRLDPALLPGAKKQAKLPRFVKPEFATLVKEAPSGEGWLHEIKLDGYRAIARIEDGRVEMYSRNDRDWTVRFGPLAEELSRLPVSAAMLDGEVVVQLEDGTPSFQSLQNDLGAGRTDRLLYYVFDLLHLDGYDLTGVPIEERKQILQRLLVRAGAAVGKGVAVGGGGNGARDARGGGGAGKGGRLRYTDDLRGEGPTFYEQACAVGIEGVVSKKLGSPYRPGARGREWLKAKCLNEQEFVIGGYTDPAGRREGFGALLLGIREDGHLRYVGKVGTGYTEKLLRELGARLAEMRTDEPPFDKDLARAPKKAHWVRPELVAEVAFAEWTRDGEIRHSSFQGLREDKDPDEVVAERAAPVAEVVDGGEPAADKPAAAKAARGRKAAAEEVLGVRITNPDRMFWPDRKLTKRSLVDYYQSVADWAMPYLLHRPVSMLRCPEGVPGVGPEFPGERGNPCFFHKHAGRDFPGAFERVEIRESGGLQTYLTITKPASLVALAQMGVLEIHIWGSRWPDIEHPDMVVFDLDPDPSAGWEGAVEGARLVRTLLQGIGLESFVKTTGGKGLHVVLPIKPSEDWEAVKAFAKAVAETIVEYAPDRYTASMAKAKRPGKTFIDYLRNGRGATAVAPYSTRAKPRATVSVPLRWEELGRRAGPDEYTIENLSRRLARLKGGPWEGYFELQGSQSLAVAMKREIGLPG